MEREFATAGKVHYGFSMLFTKTLRKDNFFEMIMTRPLTRLPQGLNCG